MTFDEFMQNSDRTRRHNAAQQQRRAGFSEAEVNKFEELFTKHARNNVIDVNDVWKYLLDLGFQLLSMNEQELLLDKIDTARELAKAMEVANCGTEGSPINFGVMLQLLRIFYHRDDRRVVDRATKAAEETRFSAEDVSEFHSVFLKWTARDSVFKEVPNTPVGEFGTPLVKGDDIMTMSKDGMHRGLRSLGTGLNAEQRDTLDQKIDKLNTNGCVDFADFLRLMRWMEDTNFANIATVTK